MAARRRWGVLAVLVTLTLGAAGACSTGSSPSGASFVPGGTVVFRNSGDFTSFDIQRDPRGQTQAIAANAYATLVTLDAAARVIPYLAKSWKSTPTSITFTLRNDAKCTDGALVTPTVAANSLKRLFEGSVGNLLSPLGGGPFTVRADEAAGTVTVDSPQPYSGRIAAFAGTGMGVICPAGLGNPALLTTQTFGAGPYELKEAVHSDHVTLKLRKDFTWGPGGITAKDLPGTVIYKIVTDETTAANLLLTGGLDVGIVNGPDVARLLASDRLHNTVLPNYAVIPMLINQAPGRPGSDVAVREAMATAIDPHVWGQLAYGGGHYIASTSFITPQANCFDQATAKLVPTPSPEKARRLLMAAGWTTNAAGQMTKNGQPLTISLVTSPLYPSTGEYMSTQLRTAGFDVKLTDADLVTWGQLALAGNFDVTYLNVFQPDAENIVANKVLFATDPPLYRTPGSSNFTSVNDPMLNHEASLAKAATGPESCAHWAAFQERLLTQYDYLPLVSGKSYVFSSKAKKISLTRSRVGCTALVQPFSSCPMAIPQVP